MGSESIAHEVEGQTHDNTKGIRDKYINKKFMRWEEGTNKKKNGESQEEQQITPNIFQNIGPSIVSFVMTDIEELYKLKEPPMRTSKKTFEVAIHFNEKSHILSDFIFNV